MSDYLIAYGLLTLHYNNQNLKAYQGERAERHKSV